MEDGLLGLGYVVRTTPIYNKKAMDGRGVSNPRSWGVTITEPSPGMMLEVGDEMLPSYVGIISEAFIRILTIRVVFFVLGTLEQISWSVLQ